MDRNNNTRRRGPKGNKKVANTYRKTYKTASSAAVVIKPITHIKKIKKSGKTYELVTVTAEYTDANKRKYESEGFTEKAQLTRELRRGKKSMGIWQLLKEVVGNSNMNNIANMFAAINLSKESSPVIEKMAQIEVDEALGDLSSMFSSRFRF
jgi:hypothetical protein